MLPTTLKTDNLHAHFLIRAATKALLALPLLLFSVNGFALPIGFGVNQGSLDYNEIKNDHFYIYHDSRTPNEGVIALESLEAARPHLESWIGVHRTDGLPVVVSAATSNASFANFITDALEVQSGGSAPRDLFLHEYVHSTMYRHFDWLFGPPGAVIHLPWMPAWFIEGLAESLSVSVGSDVQAGIERYQALSGDWPSYDRLHSLYGKNAFALRGYATSGSLVSWILKQGDPSKLPQMLAGFYRYTKPWWWVWAAVPWNGFMPMDQVLKDYAKFDGRTLYEKYKVAAAAFWKSETPGPLWAKQSGVKGSFNGGVVRPGASFHNFMRVDNHVEEFEVVYGKTGLAEKSKKIRVLPDDFKSGTGFFNHELQAYVENQIDVQGFDHWGIKVRFLDQKTAKVFRFGTAGVPLDLWDTPDAIVWWEQDLGKTSICHLRKVDFKLLDRKPTCLFSVEQPKALEVLGGRFELDSKKDKYAKEIWFNLVEQTIAGERSQIVVLDAQARKIRTIETKEIGRPISVTFTGNGVWMLSAERASRTIRKIEGDGRCIGMFRPSDHILAFTPSGGPNNIALALYAGNQTLIYQVAVDKLKLKPCTVPSVHSSPLLVALRNGIADTSLATALKGSNTWQPTADTTLVNKSASEEKAAINAATPLGDGARKSDATSGPAKWRGRSVLVGFPWIGAEDAYGTQLGIISVPVMDHMQNDTVRATFMYGVASRYPNSEVSWINTRFWPTLKLDVFRAQTFNGTVTVTDVVNGENVPREQPLYYDEKGVRGSSTWSFQNKGVTFDLGLKSSNLKPYIGPYNVREGHINEVRSDLSGGKLLGWRVTSGWSLFATVVPESINSEFDYNQLGFSGNLGRPTGILNSTFGLGLEGSRTRGKKTRYLRESYRSLKTFVPGSGGGLNKNSFPFIGTGSLFGGRYGDTQGRASANLVVPIVPDFDKLIWIFYLERLDFTAFFNYGGAWNQRSYPLGEELVGAHGYNLDFQFDLKGIRFNLGAGTGQVLGRPFEAYLTFGFDAIL